MHFVATTYDYLRIDIPLHLSFFMMHSVHGGYNSLQILHVERQPSLKEQSSHNSYNTPTTRSEERQTHKVH